MIKKSILCLLLLFFVFIDCLHAEEYTHRNCVILLDKEDNDNVGRAVFYLMTRIQSLIAEGSTPILMHASLWNSFIERRIVFKQNLEKKDSAYYKAYNLYNNINEKIEYWSNYFNSLNGDITQNKKLVVQCINKEFYCAKNNVSAGNYQLLLNYCTDFDPQDWNIYKNNGGFYLFVPKKYSTQNSETGFKTESLEEVLYPQDSSYMYFESYPTQSIVDALPDFFITYDDFSTNTMPSAWNIIVAGHGGSKYEEVTSDGVITWSGYPYISNLTIQEFHNMLDFFQSKVKTNFFHYSSCYAGGNHIELLFKNNQKKSYNFAIICDNLTDCVTYCKWRTLLPSYEKPFLTSEDLFYNITKNCWELPLLPAYDWKNFFDIIKIVDFSVGSIEKLQRALLCITCPVIGNIPLLCLPETNDFFPLQQSDVIKIDDRLVSIAQEKKSSITLNNIKTVLVESTTIEPTVTLNHLDPLRIISIKPGNALHYIKKLKANRYIDLPSIFWQAHYQRYDKTFILDTCIFPYTSDFQEIFSEQKKLKITNVIILQKKDQYMRIFFTYNDKAMMAVAHKPGNNEESNKAVIQEIVPLTSVAQEKYIKHYISLKEAATKS